MTAIWAAFRITNNTCRKNQSSANVTSHSTSSLSRSFVPICSFKLANFDPNNQIGFKYVQKPIHSFPNHVLSYLSYIIYIYIYTHYTHITYIYIPCSPSPKIPHPAPPARLEGPRPSLRKSPGGALKSCFHAFDLA